MGSTSLQPQQFLHDVGSDPWAKQDSADHDIELNLYHSHAWSASVQLCFDGFVALSANRFMHGKVYFKFFVHGLSAFWFWFSGASMLLTPERIRTAAFSALVPFGAEPGGA